MRIEINILTPCEADIYIGSDAKAYKVWNTTGSHYKLFNERNEEIRRWKAKDTDTVKDAILVALRVIFQTEELSNG